MLTLLPFRMTRMGHVIRNSYHLTLSQRRKLCTYTFTAEKKKSKCSDFSHKIEKRRGEF